jgi:hypothetical protein
MIRRKINFHGQSTKKEALNNILQYLNVALIFYGPLDKHGLVECGDETNKFFIVQIKPFELLPYLKRHCILLNFLIYAS